MAPPPPPFSTDALARYAGLLGTPTALGTNILVDGINGPDGARQEEPAITALSNGGHVVTYTSNANGGGLYQVRYKVYDAAGTVVASDLVYNNAGQGKHDWTSSVTALDGGGFVAAYFHGGDVYARIFNNNGTPAGNAFLLSTSSAGSEYSPSVTGLRNGGFMAVWSDDGQIMGRVFSSTGNPGSEFQVTSAANAEWTLPMSAASNNGGWVTVWTSVTGTTSEIKARLYDAAGNGGQELTLATPSVPANGINPASVTVLASGDFVVTWTQGSAVAGAVYSATGTALSAFTTGATGTTQSARPDVIALADGGFLIAWDSLATGDWNVKAQRFTADGTKDGNEIQVNTASTATEMIGSLTGQHSLTQLASGQIVATFLGTSARPAAPTTCTTARWIWASPATRRRRSPPARP